MKSRLLTQIWHDYCRKKLHFEIRLKLHFSSSRYYPNIIQISSRNHPEIIQKSSRNHLKIIQSTSIFTTPQLGEKSSFHPDMARLLQVKTPLLNSIKTPLLEGIGRVLLDFNSSFYLLGLTVFAFIGHKQSPRRAKYA